MTTLTSRRSDGALYIGGSFRPAAHGATAQVLDKATGRQVGSFAQGGPADVDAAVAAAVAAQPAWASLTADERGTILRRVAELFAERSDAWQDLIIRETGGIRAKARGEIGAARSKLFASAALAAAPNGRMLPGARPGKTAIIRYAPVGVVAVITPWNFPIVLGFRAIAPALALGNTVVLKPASLTPICGGQWIVELFDEAGAPPGVINLVTGSGPDVGEPLAAHPEVALIHFTGSTDVGRRMALVAAEGLKRVELELGGDNALVILDDADIDAAGACGAWAAFEFQGQTCITAGRHIVMRAIHDRYLESVSRRASGIVVGDPATDAVDLGPLISEEQLGKVDGIVRESVRMGARIVTGGTHEGRFYRPTVLDGVTADMPAFTEEIFGPILPIVTVDSEDEALRLVNSQRNLVSAVYTGDLVRGYAFAERVHAGLVHVNDAMGRPTGEDDLRTFTEPQWIGVQRTPVHYPY
jgi:benzaldehyde dehydrogenase (NAD)